MPPIAITILTALVKYGPDLVQRIVAIAHKKESTQADWDVLFADIKALDYDGAIAAAEARAKL
jgi:hypothetical protein